MVDAKPVTLTQITSANYDGAAEPQPFVIVGAGNVGQDGLITKQSGITNITADPGALADLAAARTAITATNTKINAILTALRSAGIIA